MRVFRLKPLSFCDTNCYIVASNEGNAALIDAPDDAEYILEQLDVYGLTLKMILLTHGHFDHIGAAADLQQQTGCEVYIHTDDLFMVKDTEASKSGFPGIGNIKSVENVIPVTEDMVIKLDEIEFDVLHTPGHTPGSVCYITGNVMFSGDTLFARSIGRTDMPGGDMDKMEQSLLKIKDLGGDLTIYPGHMNITSLETEKRVNIYLR
ncbi:MAG: MBL fold metallo-hydrolase [Ruminococcus sp.]|nr:MBL fold metallo-hydrolase [Ruminococcus sp.]